MIQTRPDFLAICRLRDWARSRTGFLTAFLYLAAGFAVAVSDRAGVLIDGGLASPLAAGLLSGDDQVQTAVLLALTA